MENVADFGSLVFLVEECAVQKDLTLSDSYNHHSLPWAEWRCITPSWVKSIWITSICTCDESYTIVHVAHIHII